MEFITCGYKISLILSNLEVRTLFSKIMPNFRKPISYLCKFTKFSNFTKTHSFFDKIKLVLYPKIETPQSPDSNVEAKQTEPALFCHKN